MSRDTFLARHLEGKTAQRAQGYRSVMRRDEDDSPLDYPEDEAWGDDTSEEAFCQQPPMDFTQGSSYVHVSGMDCRPQQEVDLAARAFPRSLIDLLKKPWSHYWKTVLLWGCGACVVLGVMTLLVGFPHPLYATAMALVVPAAMVTLFCELDVTRSVSWRIAALVTFIGGCVTLTIAVILNTGLQIKDWQAGFTEEPSKALVLFMLAMFPKRFPGILSGLALGVCVGAGFAVPETIDYAYNYGADGAPSTFVLLLRGVLSPFCHMAWTGALGGAMWAARGPYRSGWAALSSWTFWGIFALMILFHCLWNLIGMEDYLAVALWGLIFIYLKRGIAEVYAWEEKRRL